MTGAPFRRRRFRIAATLVFHFRERARRAAFIATQTRRRRVRHEFECVQWKPGFTRRAAKISEDGFVSTLQCAGIAVAFVTVEFAGFAAHTSTSKLAAICASATPEIVFISPRGDVPSRARRSCSQRRTIFPRSGNGSVDSPNSRIARLTSLVG